MSNPNLEVFVLGTHSNLKIVLTYFLIYTFESILNFQHKQFPMIFIRKPSYIIDDQTLNQFMLTIARLLESPLMLTED